MFKKNVGIFLKYFLYRKEQIVFPVFDLIAIFWFLYTCARRISFILYSCVCVCVLCMCVCDFILLKKKQVSSRLLFYNTIVQMPVIRINFWLLKAWKSITHLYNKRFLVEWKYVPSLMWKCQCGKKFLWLNRLSPSSRSAVQLSIRGIRSNRKRHA
jgi:hypothetical protein